MKKTKLICLKLTEDELKEAILAYVKMEMPVREDQHYRDNDCAFEWDNGMFVMSADGELEDR